MADRNVHQEWSFEAQWTWTTGDGSEGSPPTVPPATLRAGERDAQGGGGGGGGCDDKQRRPNVSRVYRDGSSEIQMEYSWKKQQPPPPPAPRSHDGSFAPAGQSSSSRSPAPVVAPSTPSFERRRPQSCHLDSDLGRTAAPVSVGRHDLVAPTPQRRLRPSDLNTDSAVTTATTTQGGTPRGTNGRYSHSSQMGDSGYSGSELSSPMQGRADAPHPVAVGQPETAPHHPVAPAPARPKNGRCRSSCDIVLEENSGWESPPQLERVRLAQPQTQLLQQPVFHGPNCECIVCHDMQVRFESVPSTQRQRILQTLQRQESDANCFRPLLVETDEEKRDDDLAKRKVWPLPVSTVTTVSPPPSQRQMYRSHFCTHVPNRRPATSTGQQMEATAAVLSAPVPTPFDGAGHQVITLQPADESYLQMLRGIEPLDFAGLTPPSPVPWRNSKAKGCQAGKSSTIEQGEPSEDRRHYRYSYPSAGGAKPKPRVIHIDVYCTEDDDDDEEDEHGVVSRVSRVSVSSLERVERVDDEVGLRPGHRIASGSRGSYYPAESGATVASPVQPRRVRSFHAPAEAERCIPIRVAGALTRPSSSVYEGDLYHPVLPAAARVAPAVEYGARRLSDTVSSVTALQPPDSPSPRRPVRHVGPTRNRNCPCDSCLRYFGGSPVPAAPFPAVDSWVRPGGVSREPRPGNHVGKPSSMSELHNIRHPFV